MTLHEILWLAAAIGSTAAFILSVLAILLLVAWSSRQRRVDANVDRDFESRRAQFPEGVSEAAVETALTGRRISPETVQRFIDRGWLNPRPNTKG